MNPSIEAGQKSPTFTLKNQTGKSISLRNYKGKKVALFFYPEDDTPTCTVEACNLRDNFLILRAKGIEIIGISPDPVQKHEKFVEKYQLPYTLLSDPQMKVINKYGVWGEKNMYGRKYMGLKRTTVLINENGKIQNVIRKVLAKKHSVQILKEWDML